jgi:WD40 repeat protein
LVSGSEDGKVVLWDGASGRQIQAMTGHDGPVRTVAFSTDGAYLATAGADGRVLVRDTATYQTSRILSAAAGAINALTFDPKDPNRLYSGGENGRVVAWDVKNGVAR